MTGLLLFLHLLGMALWLGGMFTLSLFAARARASGDPNVVAFAYLTARRLYRGAVAAGAWLTILSGAALMFVTDQPWFRPSPEHWLFQMEVLGLIVFAVTVFYIIPNAGAVAALADRARESGEVSTEFAARVKRQAIVGSTIGAALIYLVLLGSLRF